MHTPWLAPETARIVLPAVLATGYAGYHWWRWRMMHPKIRIDELPLPPSKIVPVVERAGGAQPRDEDERDGWAGDAWRQYRQAWGGQSAAQVLTDRQAALAARREEEDREAKIEFEAFDSRRIQMALRRARGHRPEYYVRLGEYAWCRGAMVETHFWVSLAKYRGVMGLDEWLEEIRKHWLQAGCPDEVENEYTQFSFLRGELARAHLMYVSGINVRPSFDFIVELAQSGRKDAQLIAAYYEAAEQEERSEEELPWRG